MICLSIHSFQEFPSVHRWDLEKFIIHCYIFHFHCWLILATDMNTSKWKCMLYFFCSHLFCSARIYPNSILWNTRLFVYDCSASCDLFHHNPCTSWCIYQLGYDNLWGSFQHIVPILKKEVAAPVLWCIPHLLCFSINFCGEGQVSQ